MSHPDPHAADLPAVNTPPRGKLFIETHGCQMNEYDSARMADVLAASDGLELTTIVEEADVILVNTCSIREKAQEKVFSRLGRWKALKKDGRPVLIGVGGCVASQEGAAIVKRAPYVDLVFGPQLPGDREVRPHAGAARRWPVGIRLDHGRLQQVLQLLRGALHPRRGSQPSVRGRAG